MESEVINPGYPSLGADGLILEGVVTTLHSDGAPHLSPMGPIVDVQVQRLHLRPFQQSTTYRNLCQRRAGVLHVTDDVELIARAATGQFEALPRMLVPADQRCPVLLDACRWYAFSVETIDDRCERASVYAQVVDSGVQREFFGFNRAKHAVIEAAILATRIDFLPADEIRAAIDRLAPLVDKTGSASEHAAFSLVRKFIDEQQDS